MLCKSCGKNISSTDEKCPFCGDPTGFLVGIDGEEDPDAVAAFSRANDNGSFRNSRKMKELEAENAALHEENHEVYKREKLWMILAAIETVILIAAVVLLVLQVYRSGGSTGNSSRTSAPSQAESQSTVDTSVVSEPGNEDASSDVTSGDESTPASSQPAQDINEEIAARKKVWDALADKQLESLTDRKTGEGKDSRILTVVSADPKDATSLSYNITFSTNGTKAGSGTAVMDGKTGVLKGKTASGQEFTVTVTQKKASTAYVVEGTKFYHGTYYVK